MVLFSSVFFIRHHFSFHPLWSHPYMAHQGHVTVLCQVQDCPGSHLHFHLHVVPPDFHLPLLPHPQRQRLSHAAPLDCLDFYQLISERIQRNTDLTRDKEVGYF